MHTHMNAGMGWGLQVGAEKQYNAVFLQSKRATDVFSDKAKVNFGGDLSVTVGPVGRHADLKGEAGTGMGWSCSGYVFFVSLCVSG